MRFKTALAVLPAWMADAGDNILAPGVESDWLRSRGLDVGLRAEGTPAPWGWSANAVRQFRKAGVAGPFPDVERLRQLSHRRTALKLHRALQGRLPYPLPPAPLEITSVSELPPCDKIILKSPWSCSGRGVVDCEGLASERIRRRAFDSIRRQGSVMVEPKLKKIRDFAMLFNEGRFCGLSLFLTSGTAYAGNIVAPQPELAAMLGVPYLKETARAVERALPAGYRGPLGVDMMIYSSESGETLICPTIEVNLRFTMGFVALALERRFGRGEFRISSTPIGGYSLIPPSPRFYATFTPRDSLALSDQMRR